jgi:hypothetical protein
MPNGTSILDTKTKAKSGILTVVVAIANTLGAAWALPALTVPADADTPGAITAIVVWGLSILVMYTPTLVTFFTNLVYTKAKTAQNIAGIAAGTTSPNAPVIRTEAATPPSPPSQDFNEGGKQSPKPPTFSIPLSKPVVDTYPGFTSEDTELMPQVLLAKIAEWFGRAASIPPIVPDIPNPTVVGYTEAKARDAQRLQQAQDEIMTQCLKIFPGGELDASYALRKNCDVRVWNRVNYFWNAAKDRWCIYGLSLWLYEQRQYQVVQ